MLAVTASAILAAIGVFVLLSYLRTAFANGLRRIPGPFLYRLSVLPRVINTWGGDAPTWHRKLHEKYGDVVRIGPNHISIADPTAVQTIYGVNSRFQKVKYSLSTQQNRTWNPLTETIDWLLSPFGYISPWANHVLHVLHDGFCPSSISQITGVATVFHDQHEEL